MMALVMIGMGVSTVVSSRYAKPALENAIKAQMNGTVRAIQNQMVSWLNQIQQDLSMWTETDSLQSELAIQSSLSEDAQ
jgi:glycogen synthase